MKLNTDRLNAFYQVALDKSFCKAADTLCITQSALSQRVLKIEQEVGSKLLIRGNDGIGLTEQGKLVEAIGKANEGKGNHLKLSIADLYQPLGENIRLTELQRLPSYQRFRAAAEKGLREIGYLI